MMKCFAMPAYFSTNVNMNDERDLSPHCLSRRCDQGVVGKTSLFHFAFVPMTPWATSPRQTLLYTLGACVSAA